MILHSKKKGLKMVLSLSCKGSFLLLVKMEFKIIDTTRNKLSCKHFCEKVNNTKHDSPFKKYKKTKMNHRVIHKIIHITHSRSALNRPNGYR